ncbi:TlpA family protein disulfide reductase [Dinghuibacter silviterrae]|uniref:Thiol-disulfide isomerase/thioredoxin n=1 Tax=Dinghuibacter silviterrae TaxID=1539049 RepID=A0A4R8DXV2_9BACT|nr:TlpA disulfide reductase family protein [Dinghuibacter silviterrae]TDX02041.1 thiol-disulfide isomerase/thioredoxin [Dinghuibacter silviterrae]
MKTLLAACFALLTVSARSEPQNADTDVLDVDSVGRAALLQFTETERDAFVKANNAAIGEGIRPFWNAYRAKKLLFVSENPDVHLSLIVFKDDIVRYGPMEGISMDSLWNFYNKYLAATYAHSPEDSSIRELFYYNTLSVGKKAPAFVQEDVHGNMVDLRKIKSRYILLNFWASWCQPCVQEIPQFNHIRSKYPADVLEFIFVSEDKAKETEGKASLKYGHTYGFHCMSNDSLLLKFNVKGIPKTYLLDRETGVILFFSDGTLTDDAIIKALNATR